MNSTRYVIEETVLKTNKSNTMRGYRDDIVESEKNWEGTILTMLIKTYNAIQNWWKDEAKAAADFAGDFETSFDIQIC